MLTEIFPSYRLTVRLQDWEAVGPPGSCGVAQAIVFFPKTGLSICLTEIAHILVNTSSKGEFSTFAGSCSKVYLVSKLGHHHFFLICNSACHNIIEVKAGRDPERSLGSSYSRNG